MSTKGLTKEKIIAEAISAMEESGQSKISLHELARRLGIKTPSLYNHIKNSKDLRHEIFRYAITLFVDNQNAATKGKQKDEAVKAFAEAYFSFAHETGDCTAWSCRCRRTMTIPKKSWRFLCLKPR